MIKENSTKDMIIKTLGKNNGVFVPLKDIYEGCGADTAIKKAGVRGILNRDCLEDFSLFERGENRSGYRLREKSLVESSKSEKTLAEPFDE